MELKFEWDEKKNFINTKKHGVSLKRNSIIRIISARKADKNDEEVYFYGYGTKNSKF